MGTRTPKSTPARKGKPSTFHKNPRTGHPDALLGALNRLSPKVRDILRSRLIPSQNALITAILACEKSGVFGEVSGSLRTHVYFPLRDLTEALEQRESRP